MRLYAAAVVSVLVYGSEAWPVSDKVIKWVGAWNARRLSFITDREIRDEYLVELQKLRKKYERRLR